jgi:hypothetical protein
MLLASQTLFRCLLMVRLATLWLLLLAGCATKSPPAATAPALTAPSLVGEIAMVNKEKHFVLIDLGSNLYLPAPGAALRSTNAAGATAHLKASPEQKRPFIAADVVDGEPAVGDEVVR